MTERGILGSVNHNVLIRGLECLYVYKVYTRWLQGGYKRGTKEIQLVPIIDSKYDYGLTKNTTYGIIYL